MVKVNPESRNGPGRVAPTIRSVSGSPRHDSRFYPATKAAIRIQETQNPPSGPTYPMKPSHELYGELLLATGKAEKARAQFETSLTRTPNRTASLLGLARAAAALGDEDAANRAYATLQTFLTEADSDVAFLDEVRSHAMATTGMQQLSGNLTSHGGGVSSRPRSVYATRHDQADQAASRLYWPPPRPHTPTANATIA